MSLTKTQEEAGLDAMGPLNFTIGTIRGALHRAGVPHEKCDRAADRLIQRERRAGNIERAGGREWRRV